MKFFLALSLTLALCTPVQARDLTIFAAASLKEPLDALLATRPDVTVSYGGSGTLARQVMAGAPADLVFLAHPDWMQALADAALLGPQGPVNLLSNEIVLVGPAGAADLALTADGLAAALGVDGRLATGLTTSVPAGIYGREALESLDLWDGVKDRLAEVDSVRAALTLTERGEVPLGLVYRTDARASAIVKVVATFPSNSHAPILYQAAITADAPQEAANLLALLTSPEGKAAFTDAGFVTLAVP